MSCRGVVCGEGDVVGCSIDRRASRAALTLDGSFDLAASGVQLHVFTISESRLPGEC